MINKLEDVEVSNIGVTDQQLEEVFTRMSKDSQLRKLAIAGNNLSSIQPEVLASAIRKLEEMNIGYTHITREQGRAVFSALDGNDLLRKLTICSNDLSSVHPELLGRVLSKVEELDISYTHLQGHHAMQLFAAIKQKGCLNKLKISWNNLSGVPPDVLAKGVAQIEEVDMESTSITTQQGSLLLSFLMEEKRLKRLSLVRNNLSEMEPEILAAGVIRLEKANLYFTSLSGEQVTCMLRECLEQDTGLRELTVREIPDVDVSLELVWAVRDKLGDMININ